MDKVSISGETKDMFKTSATYAGKSFVTTAMEAYHKKYFEEKNLPPAQNSEDWLPENREWQHKIDTEWYELTEAEPYPEDRSEATHKRLNELLAQQDVLRVFGENMVVTPEMMDEGVTAFQAAEIRYAKEEGMLIASWKMPGGVTSAQELMLKMMCTKPNHDEQEEVDESLDSWKEKQLNTKSQNDEGINPQDEDNPQHDEKMKKVLQAMIPGLTIK